jgi:hypothetical protein
MNESRAKWIKGIDMKRHFQMKVACVALAALIATFSWAALKPLSVQAAPVHKAAQQVTITIEGVVSSINGDTWVVGGVTITVTPQTAITGSPAVGSLVQVVAVAGEDNQLVAQSITTVNVASPTPSSTPTATVTGTVSPSPTLTSTPTGTLTGTPVPFVIIIIEGPIEEIDLNIIVVYGIHIKLNGDDPELAHLHVGDWVHVEGEDEQEGDGSIVVIVINIIVINPPPPTVVVPPGSDGHHDDED